MRKLKLISAYKTSSRKVEMLLVVVIVGNSFNLLPAMID